jgi:aldehyde dehydrogenase (NAD+)
MYEQWHPLGIVGVITAFNFPVAVWSWNFLIAAICGNAVIWKPSSKSPLCAIALHNIIAPVIEKHRLDGLFSLVIGSGSEIGELMIHDRNLPLISSTGSCRMGRRVGEAVAARLGRSLLELGGNNAIIITEDADMDLAVRATLFGAVGTAGQRCTTTRRIIVQRTISEKYTGLLVKSYRQIRIGNPLEEGVLMGPLVDRDAVDTMMRVLRLIEEQGGEIIYGGSEVEVSELDSGCYVEPVLVRAKKDMPLLQEETFAPILYLLEYDTLDEAIEIQNGVRQGLSSAIFTNSLKYSETFLSHRGSDCGIANVNIGTSGAEIGGAFGGEKETGGGRESGSDAWKNYMRRQTNTINWGDELPLAQGIEFEI